MTKSSVQVSSWAIGGLYLFAIVLIAMPLLDFLTSVMPARPSNFNWRYGALGLFPGYLHTPLLGLVLALGVSYWEDRVWVLKLGGAVAIASALCLVLITGVFALDVAQMHGMRPEDQTAILAGGVLQSTKYVTAGLVLALLGYGAIITGGRIRRGAASRGSANPGIVSRGGATARGGVGSAPTPDGQNTGAQM